jgi:hypothetical protein
MYVEKNTTQEQFLTIITPVYHHACLLHSIRFVTAAVDGYLQKNWTKSSFAQHVRVFLIFLIFGAKLTNSSTLAWGAVMIGMGFAPNWKVMSGLRVILGALEVRIVVHAAEPQTLHTDSP